MPQIINTNMASLNAQRNLDKSQTANQTALQRLSSGLRINSAKDDAAGMAISTRFTSQIKGLNVAVRNAGDGIALAQTAEGALGSMNDNLQRIRELAVQSANATNSDVDREALQAEVGQLIAEITRTADETDFNGRKLLDGSFKATFQIGANAGQTLDINISELTASKLGSSPKAGVSARGTDESIANGDLVINGVMIGASSSEDDSYSLANASGSAIAKAAAINKHSAETGVTAVVNENVVNGSKMEDGTAAADTEITINGIKISLNASDNVGDIAKANTRSGVIAAINSVSGQTGVTAIDGGNDNGVVLVAANGQNIVLATEETGGDLSAYGLAVGAAVTEIDDHDELTALPGSDEGVYEGGFTLVAHGDTKSIKIDGGAGTGTGDLSNTGLTRGEYKAGIATYTNDSVVATDETEAEKVAIEEGDLVINTVTIGASSATDDTYSNTYAESSSKAGSGIAIAAAINRNTDKTGVTAYVNATEVTAEQDMATAAADDSVVLAMNINGVDISVAGKGDSYKNRTAAIDAINAYSGQTGVVATDNGKGISLTAADGHNLSIGVDDDGNAALFGLENTDAIGGGVGAGDLITTYSTVRLESATSIDIGPGSKGTDGLKDSGFVRGSYGNGKDGQLLKDIDISTFEGAQKALTAIDNAIASVATQRADLGAIQNRMESTVSNLKVTSENLSAANSRIQDADFAAETAEMARTQILQQAGISVLAQANASGQNVLSLLG